MKTLANNEVRTCYNCIYGTKVKVNSDIICRVKGAVSFDYHCHLHKFVPREVPEHITENRCVDCEHFILSARDAVYKKASSDGEAGIIYLKDRDNVKIGVCHLFSVRECDGSTKKACSKFSPRRQI